MSPHDLVGYITTASANRLGGGTEKLLCVQRCVVVIPTPETLMRRKAATVAELSKSSKQRNDEPELETEE